MESLEVIQYKGYFVREDGAIFNSSGHQLKHTIVINRNNREYPKFRLYHNGVLERWFAHRLMAYLFFGPIELYLFKSMIVNHIDNDPTNYAIWNLEILSSNSENLQRRQEFSEVPF